jgi:GTP-binding protein
MKQQRTPTVAILGRPNVGKSTLFNVLTKGISQGQAAVTHATAGTTRDIRRTPAELFGLHFSLLDTAGVEEGKQAGTLHGQHTSWDAPLQSTLNQLAFGAAEQADLLLFVIDGTAGVSPADRALAQRFRKLNKPLILILNKTDTKTAMANITEAQTLGFGTPVLLSAAHNQGFEDLFAALNQHIEVTSDTPTEESEPEISPLDLDALPLDPLELNEAPPQDDATPEEPTGKRKFAELPQRPIRLAILGRPNVGKSTLTNALLGQQVMLTGPIAGLTREAITHDFTHGEHTFSLIDTPGLRRKGKVDADSLEFLSVGQSLQAAEKADVIILVIDASTHDVSVGNWQIFEQQDAQIAALAMNQYKPLILALNKWDGVKDKKACLEDIQIQLHHRLHAVHSTYALPISALHVKGLDKLIDAVVEGYKSTYATFSTGKLNNLLSRVLAKRSPPLANGKAVSLKFIRQTDNNPPTFTFWGNRIDQVSLSYKQFLRNQLSEALGLHHIPVKIHFRANFNPYHKK